MNRNKLPDPKPLSTIQDPATRFQMQEADLVFGTDLATGNDNLLFGRKTLEKIVRTGEPGAGLKVVRFWYDQDHGNQLEYLIAAVTVLKGSCCYSE